MSSVAVILHLVGTNFLLLFNPIVPTERIFVPVIVRGKEKKTIEVTVEQHPEPESNAVKRILSSERSADSDFMATEWRFQTEFNRYGEMDPELLINKIHQLELEIEALKTQVESWR